VLVADDHAVVREGVKQIVATASEIGIVGEASNGWEVLDEISKNEYDVILLDISMPGLSGVETLKELRKNYPGVAVLVLSIYPEEQFAVRMLEAGASGYLNKESAPEQLLAAIKKVALGGKFVTPALAEKMAIDLEVGVGTPPHYSLSDREFEVMCMIASGRSLKDIADELYLSVKTISTYRQRILRKMKMKSNVDLTRYAMENQLVN
jgi:DNA-binding NarL/FixJ family response regulator